MHRVLFISFRWGFRGCVGVVFEILGVWGCGRKACPCLELEVVVVDVINAVVGRNAGRVQ